MVESGQERGLVSGDIFKTMTVQCTSLIFQISWQSYMVLSASYRLKQRKGDTQDMALHQQLEQKLQPRQLDDTGTAAIEFAESKPVMAVTAAVA
jgi:hypothetical protein